MSKTNAESEAIQIFKKLISNKRGNLRERYKASQNTPNLSETKSSWQEGKWEVTGASLFPEDKLKSELSYLDYFGGLINDEAKQIIENLIYGQNIRILDLMSYGAAVRSANLHSNSRGLSVGFSDLRNDDEKELDLRQMNGFLQGNVFSASVCLEILNWQIANGCKFDLVFCRPLGALNCFPNNFSQYSQVFECVCKVTKSGAWIFFEFPKSLEIDLYRFLNILKQRSLINFQIEQRENLRVCVYKK